MLLRRRRARGVLIPHTQPSCEFSFHCVRERSMYELVSVRARIREPLENIIINTRSSVCAKRNAHVYAHRRCRFCFTVACCTHACHLTQQYDSLLLLRARAIYISLSLPLQTNTHITSLAHETAQPNLLAGIITMESRT